MDRVRSADHAHDFPGLVYFEREGGSLLAGNRERSEAGDLRRGVPRAGGACGTPGGCSLVDRIGVLGSWWREQQSGQGVGAPGLGVVGGPSAVLDQ